MFSAEYKGRILDFFGGGDSRGFSPEGMDVIISLNSPCNTVLANFPLESFKNNSIKVVYLPVEDYEAPKYTKEFLLGLLDSIIKVIEKDPIAIAVKCTGGHGRTGTILAAYLGILTDVKDPVKYLREVYCKNAVETIEQIEYIEKVTGKKTKESPSRTRWLSSFKSFFDDDILFYYYD